MTMTQPRFPVQITRGIPVVIAPEEIDITNASQLRAALLRAATCPGPFLVVDMTRTRFCDSAGLHTLIAAHKRSQAEGRQIKLVVTGAQLHRIIALTALDRLIPVCTTLDQALTPPAAPEQGRRTTSRIRLGRQGRKAGGFAAAAGSSYRSASAGGGEVRRHRPERGQSGLPAFPYVRILLWLPSGPLVSG
jgi:anti-sigma B factor antagonist